MIHATLANATNWRIIAKSMLLSSVSVAMFQPVLAQPSSSPAPTMESIYVTGSRIRINGYDQPTPVTSVTKAEIEREMYLDIGEAISSIPSSGTATSPNTSQGSQSVSGANAGLSLVNLRGLGVNRTLVLYDGTRVVQSNGSGGVDMNMIPAALVQRIDVVTGGASAAWGSDAVAGVVNVILNKQFTGWAVIGEASGYEEGNRSTDKFELSFGKQVLSGRGHILLSGTYRDSPDVVQPTEMSWFKNQALMDNPNYTPTNGEPRLVHAENVGLWSMTPGGVVTSGPLKGIQFVGPQGTPVPFEYGQISGTLMTGGTFVNPALVGSAHNLAVPIRSETLFGYFSYDFSENITGSIELNYGQTETLNGGTPYTRQGDVQIKIDNPYLDPAIAARMAALNLASFPLGTTNTNNGAVWNDPWARGLGNLHNKADRDMSRAVANLKGQIGGWLWDASLQVSEVSRDTNMVVNPVVANYNRAVDAVGVTSANVGDSGLQVGSIVCRSTLTTPENGCQPLNILGEGVATEAAIAYVNNGEPRGRDLFKQETAMFSIQGQPFSTWAGFAAAVGGLEYRRESTKSTADPISYARGYAAGNWQYMDAGYDVKEAFLEMDIPLVSDGFVDALDLNAALRVTDYSTSGVVETWKVGITSSLNENFRIRATVSSDIRAPTLQELFNPGWTSNRVVSDPFRPGSNPTNIFALNGGNPDLKPEIAKTITGGVIWSPAAVPGFTASLDYYSIEIDDAIVGTSFDYVLAQCFAGREIFCPLIRRNAEGIITIIAGAPVNAAAADTSGFDFESSYSREIFNGFLTARIMANYTNERVFDQRGVVADMAGSLNRDPPNIGQGLPKFKAIANLTYTQDRYAATVQLRGIGSAKLNNAWTSLDVDDNSVPSVTYLDIRASMSLDSGKKYQAFLAINNVLSEAPPIVAHSSEAGLPYFYIPTRTDIYDTFGRSWRVGLRATF
jgi:iron complex outermembrane recepter protein